MKRSFTILNQHPVLRLIMSIRKDLMKDGRVKLIIVEDSPLLMRLLTDELTEAGYSEIVAFENGKKRMITSWN